MQPAVVVDPYRLRNRLVRLSLCLEVAVEEVLPLENAVEPLGHCVLVAVKFLGHARLPSERVQKLAVCVRRVLAPPVGMRHDALRLPNRLRGHPERFQGPVRLERVAYRPADDLVSAGNATSWGEEMTIKYEDDEITKITDVSTVEYADSAAAKAGIENFKNYYASLLAKAELTNDPFDSRYARVDGTLTITYTGQGTRLNAQNAVIFSLPVEDDELKADLESVQDSFKERGFSCQEKDD